MRQGSSMVYDSGGTPYILQTNGRFYRGKGTELDPEMDLVQHPLSDLLLVGMFYIKTEGMELVYAATMSRSYCMFYHRYDVLTGSWCALDRDTFVKETNDEHNRDNIQQDHLKSR